MAWRNLWRNRRRTLITVASVFFAVFFALFMRSLQLGSYDYMYKNVIESYSGYIQLQQQEWWYDKSVDNSFEFTEEVKKWLLADENIEQIIPRIESFALAAGELGTKGVMVMGIDPEKENLLSDIGSRVARFHLSPEAIEQLVSDDRITDKTKALLPLYEGSYFSDEARLLSDLGVSAKDTAEMLPLIASYTAFENEPIQLGKPGVWLGVKLATYLNLAPGDTLVLLGQGYHGSTAAGKYEIKGLINLPVSEISGRIVYLPYDIAQQLYNTGNNLTSVVLHLNDNSNKGIKNTTDRLSIDVPEGSRIIDWREMNEVIIQQMEADNISGIFMIGILYVVIAFGIIGTVLMMTAERKREFGVLVAVGMQKKKLASVITYEMFYIGLLGVLLGCIVTIPIILYGVENPIIFKGELAHMMEEYDFEPKLVFEPVSYYFLWQALVVGLMVLVSLIHPVKKIFELKVVNALKA